MSSPGPSNPSKAKEPRTFLPEKKGREVLGILLLLLALLLAASLISFHPSDPSILHQSTQPARVHNVIGAYGADAAAILFGSLGLTAFLVPLLLLVTAIRKVRLRTPSRVVGRGLGAIVILGSLPALLQLTLGEMHWMGSGLAAGGAVGDLLAESLRHHLGTTGALFVALGAVVIGSTLLVQATLGEMLAQWNRRLRAFWESWRLARERRRERRHKERARKRVVARQLERAREAEPRIVAGAEADPTSAGGGELDLPLRVEAKPGVGSFAVRRVAPAAEEKAKAKRKSGPQAPLPFSEQPQLGAKLPPLNLLQLEAPRPSIEENDLVRLAETIRSRCAEFGVEGTIEGISPGPVITVFEFQPAPGVKVSQIVNLQDDLALALKAESVRIDRIPGRSTLGIEVPNRKRQIIRLGHLLEQDEFRKSPSLLTMAIGTTVEGRPYFADLASMPHLLVAGATGSGKSAGLQTMITSILYKATRDQVQFIMIDPKRIELGVYADIPHLKAEVVVEPKKAANALRWAVAEMERRYRLLAEVHVRSIEYYNRAILDPEVQQRLSLNEEESPFAAEDLKPLPYYVVIIDELADLMVVASAEVESSIARLAQMARAVGIHLIVATQRPSVDVLTGTIKANFPCRISFATASRHDSRTILDQVGSEKLLGKGDMLFMPPGTARMMRLHGAYVSEQETAALIRWLKKQGRPALDPTVVQPPEDERSATGGAADYDELFDEAARLVVAERQASASFLQRRMRIGFSRAARLIDMMEQDGLLGPPQGSKPRDVLVGADYFAEIDRART